MQGHPATRQTSARSHPWTKGVPCFFWGWAPLTKGYHSWGGTLGSIYPYLGRNALTGTQTSMNLGSMGCWCLHVTALQGHHLPLRGLPTHRREGKRKSWRNSNTKSQNLLVASPNRTAPWPRVFSFVDTSKGAEDWMLKGHPVDKGKTSAPTPGRRIPTTPRSSNPTFQS